MHDDISKMQKLALTVGWEHDDSLVELNRIPTRKDFEGLSLEGVKSKFPYLFYDNGNNKCIHISSADKRIIANILRIAKKQIAFDGTSLSMSLAWQFHENKDELFIWVCLSGFFVGISGGEAFSHGDFRVSSNIVNDEQTKATEDVIDYINSAMNKGGALNAKN